MQDRALKYVSMISQINDLKDARAREIARRFSMDMQEVFPLYLDVVEELLANKPIDTDNPDTSLNVYALAKRQAACGALVNYELTRRKVISLPKRIYVAFLKPAYYMKCSVGSVIHRELPVALHESFGRAFEKFVDDFEAKERQFFEKILS